MFTAAWSDGNCNKLLNTVQWVTCSFVTLLSWKLHYRIHIQPDGHGHSTSTGLHNAKRVKVCNGEKSIAVIQQHKLYNHALDVNMLLTSNLLSLSPVLLLFEHLCNGFHKTQTHVHNKSCISAYCSKSLTSPTLVFLLPLETGLYYGMCKMYQPIMYQNLNRSNLCFSLQATFFMTQEMFCISWQLL